MYDVEGPVIGHTNNRYKVETHGRVLTIVQAATAQSLPALPGDSHLSLRYTKILIPAAAAAAADDDEALTTVSLLYLKMLDSSKVRVWYLPLQPAHHPLNGHCAKHWKSQELDTFLLPS